MILDEYFNFLTTNGLGSFDNEIGIFPDMSLEWDAPSSITNAIIDIEELEAQKIDYDKVFQQLSSFNCACIQIRCITDISAATLLSLLKSCRNTRIKEVRLVLQYGLQEAFILDVINTNKRISQIVFYCSPRNVENKEIQGVEIIFNNITALGPSDCGSICDNGFSINIAHYTESINANTCLNRKLSIDSKGFIKNCPSQSAHYGHVSAVDLHSVIHLQKFKELWALKKDDIEICKDCEHRHVCTDCRIFIQNSENILSKPSKCNYDPYTATWS